MDGYLALVRAQPLAMAMLHAIPAGSSCAELAQMQKDELYARVQQQECTNLMQQAAALAAADKYDAALGMLARIDAESPCAAQSRQQIAELEKKADADLQQRYEWLFKYYSAGAEVEKARWNAISLLCADWMKNNARYPLTR